MANLIQDNIRLLLSQHLFRIDSRDLNENLMCILCKNLIYDAYQTYCGCQYCHLCIVEYLKNDKVYCVGDKEECKDEQLELDVNVHRNAMLNRKALKAKIFCPYESCTYSSNLTQMEDHLRMCTKQEIECPYLSIGCDSEKAMKDTILTHLHNEALPHTQLMIDLIQNLRNDLSALKDRFEEKEQQFDAIMNELKNAEIKINKQETEIASLKKESENQQKEIESMKKGLKDAELESETSKADLSTSLKNTEVKLFQHLQRWESKVENDKIVNLNMITRMEELTQTIDLINFRTNMTGEMFFEVDCFKNACKANNVFLVSNYFYSHFNGYKLRLAINPGGNTDGKPTHLCVGFQICKGEYDELLPWPCRCSISIAMVDTQRGVVTDNGETWSYDTTEIECRDSFCKPKAFDNITLGNVKFMSHAYLKSNEGLTWKDRIMIKCTVTPPRRL